MKKTEPKYYPPVENLLDLIYEHYTENNPVEKNTVAGKAAKAKEKELEKWLRGLDELDLIRDYASVFGKGNNYHYFIFSKGGFTDGLLQAQERGEVRLITLEDLYK